jgi:hypothetical protein
MRRRAFISLLGGAAAAQMYTPDAPVVQVAAVLRTGRGSVCP